PAAARRRCHGVRASQPHRNGGRDPHHPARQPRAEPGRRAGAVRLPPRGAEHLDPRALEDAGRRRLTRTFVAVDIPAAHRAKLAAYLEACQAVAPTFRWAPAANLHLTLRFCGGLEDVAAERL